MFWFKRKKPKVGLCLGSGAARGLAHIGAVKALLEKGARIDMISGVSIGAVVGAVLAKYGDVANLETEALGMDFKNLLRLADPNIFLLFKGFVSGNKVEDFLKLIIGDVDFKDLRVPFYVVATDIRSGEEVIIDKGPVVKAVRASISMPAIFTPFVYMGRVLIDGGIVNPLPVDILKARGADYVIASNVIHRMPVAHKTSVTDRKEGAPDAVRINEDIKSMGINIGDIIVNMRKMFIAADAAEAQKEIPSMFETIVGAVYTMEHQMLRHKERHVDLMIKPEVEDIAALEFYRAQEAIAAGYRDAVSALNGLPLKYLNK